jgi:hypothetical protein
MMIRSRTLVVGAAVFMLAVVFYPAQVTIVPRYTVRVLDADGLPFPGIRVIQTWQEYSIQADGRDDALTANGEGYARFPVRNVRASVSKRVIGCIHQFREYGAHASCGSRYDITAGDGTSTEVRRVDVREGVFGGSRSLTLVMKRCPPGQHWPCQ